MTKTNAQAAVAAKQAKASPKAATVNKDAIVQSSGTKSAGGHFVMSAGGDALTFATALWAGEIRKLAAIGASFSALKAALVASGAAKLPDAPVPQLARGVAAKDAVHSAKAVSDAAREGKASNKADAATQKPKAPKTGVANDRAYTLLSKDHGARPDSKRAKQLMIVFAHKSTALARKAGAETCDFAFAAAKGFIKFG